MSVHIAGFMPEVILGIATVSVAFSNPAFLFARACLFVCVWCVVCVVCVVCVCVGISGVAATPV